jgi:hypothetical protein
VTITGTGFVTGATVTFGGTAATAVTVVNATTITATTPAHAAGAVNVVVTNPDSQSGTCTGCFTFVAAPTVTGIAPTSGPAAGGTSVTITGTGFVAGATVSLGGTAATGVTVVNATTITATTPAHSAGAVNVTVTNPDSQSGTCTGCFTYVAGPPSTQHSLAVDGATGCARAPDAAKLNLAGNWTLEAWIKDQSPDGYNHDFAEIVGKHDDAVSNSAPYFMTITSNTLRAGNRASGPYNYSEIDLTAFAITAGDWHHVAASFTASTRTIRLFVDGVMLREENVGGTLSTSTTVPLSIGCAGTAGKFWTGKIDDVRIWNVVRTEAEIAANYQTEFTTAPAGLIANWKFNEASGTTAADSTASPDNATLNGGASFSTDVHP